MYLHFNDHIYLCFHGDCCIILDLKEDSYYIVNEGKRGDVKYILEHGVAMSNNKYHPKEKNSLLHETTFDETVQELLDHKIVTAFLFEKPYPYFVDIKENSSGMDNIDWRLPLETFCTKNTFKNVVVSFYYLTLVHFLINFKGFYSLIKLIKKKKPTNCIVPSLSEIENLQHCLNKACKIFPLKTKCLEWAATLCLISLKKRWRVNMIVGVQNYPFMAHAWIEVEDEVIGDDLNLKKNLAVILKEPFRPEI